MARGDWSTFNVMDKIHGHKSFEKKTLDTKSSALSTESNLNNLIFKTILYSEKFGKLSSISTLYNINKWFRIITCLFVSKISLK